MWFFMVWKANLESRKASASSFSISARSYSEKLPHKNVKSPAIQIDVMYLIFFILQPTMNWAFCKSSNNFS